MISSLLLLLSDPNTWLKWSVLPFSISFLTFLGLHLCKKKDMSIFQSSSTLQEMGKISFLINVFFINYAYQLTDTSHPAFSSALFYALTSTFQTFTLDLNYEEVTRGLALLFNHDKYWKIYIGVILLAAPIVFGETILTLLASSFPEIKTTFLFFFAKLRRRNIYIFSRLNEHSIAYAEDIVNKKNSKPAVVFCNCKFDAGDSDSLNLESRASKRGWFCFRQDVSSIYLYNKKVTYYFIHDDDLVNSDEAVYIATEGNACWNKCDTVKVVSFSQNDLTKDILEAIWKKEKMPNVRIIPYVTNTIYNTLLKHPLFLEAGENLDVAIVGDNIWATEIFKAILWYGQFENVVLNLKCFTNAKDKYSSNLVSNLEKFCSCSPKSKNEPYCNYEFLSEDEISASEAKIWFVCRKSDEDSMNTAYHISQGAAKGTQIFYQINRDSLATGLEYRHKELSSNGCEMHIFGTMKECYSSENVEGKLIQLAAKMEKAWDNPGDNMDDEYKRRSSLAAALHIPYKLYALGLLKNSKDVTELCESEDFVKKIKKCLKEWNKNEQKKNCKQIARMEHIRWIAYMRTIRYTEWNTVDFKKLPNSSKLDSKDHIHKLHLALVSYDKLEGVSRLISDKGTDRDFVYETSRVLYDLRNTLWGKKRNHSKGKSNKSKEHER